LPSGAYHQLATNNRRVRSKRDPRGITTDAGHQMCFSSATAEACRASGHSLLVWNEFAGRPTTSGELFDPHRLTAASIAVPLGSVVKVENPRNGRSVRVIAVPMCSAAVSISRSAPRRQSALLAKARRARENYRN